MDAAQIKFRASEIGILLTNPRSKSEALSETCKTQLINIFVREQYGRREEITSKFLEHGIETEQDAITLFSRVTKKFYKKNNVRLTNDFVTGEVDIFIGESIEKAEEIVDIKSSYSANTFFRSKHDSVNPHYIAQGHVYMALTGAKKHTIAYCLVNGTERAISDEKRRLAYSMGVIDTTSKSNTAYVEKCKQIEINHIFCLEEFIAEYPWFDFDNDINAWRFDIPMKDRLFTFEIERNENEIQKIYDRVQQCRKWMNDNLFNTELENVIQKVDYSEKIKEGKRLMKLLSV